MRTCLSLANSLSLAGAQAGAGQGAEEEEEEEEEDGEATSCLAHCRPLLAKLLQNMFSKVSYQVHLPHKVTIYCLLRIFTGRSVHVYLAEFDEEKRCIPLFFLQATLPSFSELFLCRSVLDPRMPARGACIHYTHTYTQTHTHPQTHTCVCVCVCV